MQFSSSGFKFCRFRGFAHFCFGDIASIDEVAGFLQGLHALFSTGLNLGVELGCFAFADQVGGGG